MEEKQEIDRVLHHVYAALRGGIAELDGDRKLAQRLNAETKLRLVTMSDGELVVLAKMLAPLLGKSVEAYYEEIKAVIESRRAQATEWIGDLGKSPGPEEGRQDG